MKSESLRDVSCPLCDGGRFAALHRQEFLLPGDIRTHYAVVACESCGFVFARDLPLAEEYESYYRTNLKYTYEGSRDAANALFAIHEPSFRLVDQYATRESRILDIGCSTGELLALFQRNGYARLEGVDPAPECRQIAKQLYGLDIKTAVLSEITPDGAYDVVLLANVLEHIPNLDEAIRHVSTFLSDGGLLFVQVPDAGHFGDAINEPFLEFSIEHINYFTEASLANLLRTIDVFPVDVRHDVVSYRGVAYPVITSVWRKGAATHAGTAGDPTPVRDYIVKSGARLNEVKRAIDALVDGGEPLVIWGTGSLTARLLATTNLANANITGFVDSNTALQGKQLLGKPIAAPSSLAGRSDTVFISSFVYGADIRNSLERDLRYGGRIITI
jgi:SAM-dependent methyltransferase